MRNLRTKCLIAGSFLVLALAFQNCAPGFSMDESFSLSSLSNSIGSAKTRRLSNLEYKQALPDILLSQFARRPSPPTLAQFYTSSNPIRGALSSVPTDSPNTKLGTDQLAANLSQARLSAYINVAYAVGKQIAGNDAHLRKFAGACAATDSTYSDQACIDTFVTEFATLAFRTPPTAAEKSELKKNSSNWHTLIARVLVHPRFLLHFERDGAKD